MYTFSSTVFSTDNCLKHRFHFDKKNAREFPSKQRSIFQDLLHFAYCVGVGIETSIIHLLLIPTGIWPESIALRIMFYYFHYLICVQQATPIFCLFFSYALNYSQIMNCEFCGFLTFSLFLSSLCFDACCKTLRVWANL